MLADRIRNGEVRAAARLMRLADDRDPGAIPELKDLYPSSGRAHVVGFTGNPGSGKSTLVDMTIRLLRKRDLRVGVVAVDPSSPFTGGAILGDRIRMQKHSEDPGVFIRSLATRGHLGGLSRSTNDVVMILDAMGCDVVIVETVGVGQDEVDIIRTAHTSVVVLVPGLGDEIQSMKAGILEIADVFVVNKADRDGAEKVIAELQYLQHLVEDPEQRSIPILQTVAVRNEGVDQVVEEILQHHEHLRETGDLLRREQDRARAAFRALLVERFLDRVDAVSSADAELAHLDGDLAARRIDPYTAADRVLSRVSLSLD